jgi:hypothetical protein
MLRQLPAAAAAAAAAAAGASSTQPAPGSVPGDPYIRVRMLGQGSFGRVLLVRDGRQVQSAPSTLGGPQTQKQQFYVMKVRQRRESRICQAQQHTRGTLATATDLD